MKGEGEAGGGTPEAQGKATPPVFLADTAELERGSITLTGAEGRHAATVRRLSAGEQADVTDGAGTIAECTVTRTGPGVIELAVLTKRTDPGRRAADRRGSGDPQGRPRRACRRDR